MANFTELIGKTFDAVRQIGEDEIRFERLDGQDFRLFHSQDCCETVIIESITGNLSDLVGSPILFAEEATSDTRPADLPEPEYEDESQTWTFYKLATIKGWVDIRWHGSSNGYYSESVSFEEA